MAIMDLEHVVRAVVFEDDAKAGWTAEQVKVWGYDPVTDVYWILRFGERITVRSSLVRLLAADGYEKD